jgi:hypothetical protein
MSSITTIVPITAKALTVAALTAACASAPLLAQTASLDVAARAPRMVQPQAIAGMTPRYIVTEMRSIVSAGGNVTTSIRITNMSSRTCSYGIEYYFSQGASAGGMRVCTLQMPDIPKFNTVFPCSRDLSSSLATSCSPVCNPELTGNAGKAIIYSQDVAGCERMAVNATIVNSSSDDSVMVTMRTPKIVRYGLEDSIRTNRGD